MTTRNTHHSPAIVVGTNGSQRAHAAVVRASILAYSREAELHVVCAHDRLDSISYRMARTVAPADIEHALTPRGEAAEVVEAALQTARAMGVDVVGHCVQDSLVPALRAVATDTGAEAIVMGASRRRSRLVETLAPAASHMLAKSGICPVVLVDTAHGPALRLVSDNRRVVAVRSLGEPAIAV